MVQVAKVKPFDVQPSPGSQASAAEATLRQRAVLSASRAEGNVCPGPAEAATVGS